MSEHTCTRCDRGAPDVTFTADVRRSSGLQSHCESCRSTSKAVSYRKDPGPALRRARDHRYRRVYGITEEEYQSLLESQNGVCAICDEKNVAGWRLAVDHDHATGVVRGLLCNLCNTAAERFATPTRRAALIAYFGGDRISV